MKNTEGAVTESFFFRKGRFKFWVLALIILFGFWSMFSGTAILKWSVGNLSHFKDELLQRMQDDFDVLEIEAREKVVRHLWDIYIHNPRIKLTKFWQQAFFAAYEELESEEPDIRKHAITEIAKMSLSTLDMDLDMQRSMQDRKRRNKNRGKKQSVQ